MACCNSRSLQKLRRRLQHLWRYITRQALFDEQAQRRRAGGAKTLKTPWRDGTPHQVMCPLEFMQRLTALMPRLQLHAQMTAARLQISTVTCSVRFDGGSTPAQSRCCKPALRTAIPNIRR
jgi:hypothetical protein